MKKGSVVNKLIRFVIIYLLIGIPFVVACMIWSNAHSEYEVLKNTSFLIRASWQILSWNLMLWFAVLIIFLVILVAAPSARENTLRHIANLKERDEREEYITGKASRAAYISTLSLTLLFLFFSIFSLSINRFPADQNMPKRHLTVSIHIGSSLLAENKSQNMPEGEVLFATKNIMPSTFSILIILLAWQLLIFNYTARKEQKIGLE